MGQKTSSEYPSQIFLCQKREIPAHFHTRTDCAEICLCRCVSRCHTPISTACHPAHFFVEYLQRKSAYLCGFASYDSTKLKNYTKNYLKIFLFSTGASALFTTVCSCFAPTIPFLDAKTNKGIRVGDTLRFAMCARHSRDRCLLRSHFSPLTLRKALTASLRSLPSGPSTGRSDGCPFDVSPVTHLHDKIMQLG